MRSFIKNHAERRDWAVSWREKSYVKNEERFFGDEKKRRQEMSKIDSDIHPIDKGS